MKDTLVELRAMSVPRTSPRSSEPHLTQRSTTIGGEDDLMHSEETTLESHAQANQHLPSLEWLEGSVRAAAQDAAILAVLPARLDAVAAGGVTLWAHGPTGHGSK